MKENIEKKRLLILYNNLFHYRIPIFKLLEEKYDLTVAYSIGPDAKESLNFGIKKIPILKYRRLVIHKYNIFRFCQDFDVVIAYGDIAWLKLSTLPFHKSRKFKILFWAIGVSASYNKGYDSVKKWDTIRDFFYKRADALIFYSDYPIQKYLFRGFCKEKLFVAPNTVEVSKLNVISTQKDSILFIGTLYMQKGILALLENYKLAFLRNQTLPILNLIGGGDEYENVQAWISSNSLSNKIILHGPVFDINEKAKFFQRSFACISPNQAGLSVLESMGYGIPFITSKNSLTGGELFNIKNGINGILFDDINQLADIIFDISVCPQKYLQMGVNAQNYYNECRKPTDMVNGICDAINYVLQ